MTEPAGGKFLNKELYDTPHDAVDALYLKPYNNDATYVQVVESNANSFIFEGGVYKGWSDAKQTLVNPRDFIFSIGVTYAK